jgi:hypothetical protein
VLIALLGSIQPALAKGSSFQQGGSPQPAPARPSEHDSPDSAAHLQVIDGHGAKVSRRD